MGSASKVDKVTALPSRHKMADMCYYGNVMTTRWWLCVTMETLWQQRCPNIQMTCKCMICTFAVEDVYTELVIDVFYIFNCTVIDW